jgi:predicted ATPase/DNA-binding XRE family transcriptional regulator
MNEETTFAELLKRHRIAAGLTQEELAERARLSARSISDLERGINRRPYPHTMRNLVQGLGLPEREADVFRRVSRGIHASATSEWQETARATRLPAQPTPFIGRARELDEIRSLLIQDEVRLVTLTGPGGVGKTRLAHRLAETTADSYRDGVAFVPLASLDGPDLVPGAVAGAVRAAGAPGDSVPHLLISRLSTRQMLLVLDNFEHLLSAAPFVADLLASCLDLGILVTSRAVLHLQAEREYPVLPLPLPTPSHLPETDVLSRYEAVQLFLQRARAVRPELTLTAENGPVVAEICRRVDGLPLAIELVAARMRVFSPDALLARLASPLHMLTGGARDSPARQQTLRAALDWSYSLLSEDERALLARLCVFAGGCTLEAAEAVTAVNGDIDVPNGITSLSEQSLLRPVGSGRPRFVMLQTIREYSAEKVRERGEAEEIARRHAEYFIAFMEHVDYETTRTPAFVREVREERDNLLAALSWLRDHEESMLGLRLVGAIRGWEPAIGLDIQPWLAIFEPALSQAPPSLRARVMLAEAWNITINSFRSGSQSGSSEPEDAVSLINAALALFRQESDPWIRVRGLIAGASGLAYNRLRSVAGAMEAAEQAFGESLTIARSIGSAWAEAAALRGLGHTTPYLHDDWEASESLIRQSLAVERRAGNTLGAGDCLWALAGTAWERGDRPQAIDLWAASIAEHRKAGVVLPHRLFVLAFAHLQLGQPERVLELFRDVAGSDWALDLDDEYRSWLVLLASAAVATGDFHRAARLFAAVSPAWGDDFHWNAARFPSDFQAYRASVREHLGEASWAALWEEGRSMTLERAIAYALGDSVQDPVPSAVADGPLRTAHGDMPLDANAEGEAPA